MGIFNTLISAPSWIPHSVRKILDPLFLFLMVALSIATIVVILMQKATTDKIGAVGGESDTYIDKNKGQGKERGLKIATLVLGACLVVVSILYFLIQIK